MKASINLLPEKARLQFAQIERFKRAKVSLLVGTIIFSLFSALVLAYNIQLKKQNGNLQLRLKIVQERIEKRKEIELQVFLLKERVQKVEEILKERKNFGRVLWDALSVLPPEADIRSAGAEAKNIQIVFELPSYQQASEFIDNFPEEKIKELGGKKTGLSTLSRTETGSYQIGLEIEF